MEDNSTNLSPVEETNPQKRTTLRAIVGMVGIGFCALFLIAFFWFQPGEKSLFAKYFPSPSLTAYDSIGSYLYLEDMADIRPDLPDINQPGDIYLYLIQLEGSDSLLWRHGWCTTTQENFE